MRPPPWALAGAAALLQRVLPGDRRPTPTSRLAALPLVVASGWLGAGALREFARAGTTFHPGHPDRARAVVSTGPNAVTRNPMYLGLAGLLAAHAVWRRSPPALLPVAAFLVVLDRGQVRAEERALTHLAGYADYLARVPRWL